MSKVHHSDRCFYCKREYGKDVCLFINVGKPLFQTKDHILSKSQGGINHPINYISSCVDCNTLKSGKDARGFAILLSKEIDKKSNHPMKHLFKHMMFFAWKIHNKRMGKIRHIIYKDIKKPHSKWHLRHGFENALYSFPKQRYENI